jgi:carboxypeptidase Taq
MDATDRDDVTAEEGRELLRRWADIAALDHASGLLGWDQETYLPPKGRADRGHALAALAGLRHERLTDPALADAAERAAAHAEPGSVLEAHVREARRAITHATAVPESLARHLAEQESRSLAAWQAARAEDDFAAFEPELAEIVRLNREKAQALVAAGVADRPYDAMLDQFEPGATEAQLVPIFETLRAELTPLVAAVADSGVTIDESPARGDFPRAAQQAFAHDIAEAIGYDLDAGRIDEAAHPFTSAFGIGDVRITWRFEPDDFRPGLLITMHEVGHALYEQGLDPALAHTPAGAAVSLGVHESQSRLWENQVGRSRSFWRWALPRWHRAFPDKADVDLEALWPALHPVRPSLIRVEADEVTYNLHIVARFEIERALFAGDVEAVDLPGLWDDTYEALLGLRAPSAADGVLQDIHWSMGAFGYFPTYTLGNLISAQVFSAAARDLGDLDAQFAQGEFAPLLGWLRDRIHRHGSLCSATDLVETATGAPPNAEAWLTHVRSLVADVYGVGR